MSATEGRRLRALPSLIAAERLRVLPGIGGAVAPVTVTGMSENGAPLIKVEVPLAHIGEATCFVRDYLTRRDLGETGIDHVLLT